MIARRVAAVALTVVLIAGSYLIRSRVIEGDDASPAIDRSTAATLVCLDELADACRSLGDLGGLPLVIESAAATLDRLQRDGADSVIWVTLAPFPEMAAQLRVAASALAIDTEQTVLASSPLVLVVRTEDTATVTDRCAATAIELRCLGDLTDLSPTFAPTSSAVGTLGVASALVAFGGGSFDADSFELLTWARTLKRAGARSLSGGTAVGTIQTRPTFGIALGAEAELTEAGRRSLDVLDTDPMVRLEVEMMVPDGVSAPGDLAGRIRDALFAAGWDAAGSGGSGVPDPGVILAARTFWEEL
jgi:hypothetical protein